ncbi:aminotransferase class I/II-fold pyridoxal phosphate-dependent enzyme [Metabacillus sp. RGM 3146]|uniref:aminotransferase class I/II-fold pyridoxal phosphate-dependent enzyme n=1 Tax=Metabacillus sp. RGM 3146 TaxID=3401092 RepID=UPI003B9B1D96
MNTPLFSALVKHSSNQPVSFHVPGHKNGEVFPYEGRAFFQNILQIDATEITGLDDLHEPEGPIAEAMELAAHYYGVQQTYFLVNGSTAGNLAMILSCCGTDDLVLVQRNSHKSIINAIELAGAIPVFLGPGFEEGLQVPSHVPQTVIEKAIEQYPDANALVLTSPNYYGLAGDLSWAVKKAHSKGIPVLIDEAHGAHFSLGAPFPASAIEAGSDIVIHSAHKTLPAMTMGSYLHFNSSLVDREKVEHYLSVLQSSSPSYPIMASLDLARAYLQDIAEKGRLQGILKAAEQTKKDLSNLPGIKIMSPSNPVSKVDPLKVTVCSEKGVSGFELQRIFEKSGFFGELADHKHFLLVLALNEWNPFAERYGILWENLSESKDGEKSSHTIPALEYEPIARLPVSYASLKKREIHSVSFKKAIGSLSAEAVIPYPPGIPLLAAGERIAQFHLDQIQSMIAHGTRFHGGRQLHLGTLAVYK